MAIKTDIPVEAGNFSNVRPEFGRTKDVERVHGLKRGTLYNLHSQNKIKGCLLRVKGQKTGVRLWDMDSIRSYIQSQMVYSTSSQHPHKV